MGADPSTSARATPPDGVGRGRPATVRRAGTERTRVLFAGLLAAALVANALLIADQIAGGGRFLQGAAASGARGENAAPAGPTLAELQAREAEATYRSLIVEATGQQRALERRAVELAERERQFVVLRKELERAAATRTADDSRRTAPATTEHGIDGDLSRVARTFGNMSPENAARTLLELYSRDRRVAVEVALGLPPARAAAILDAVAQSRPAVAAEIALAAAGRESRPR